MDFLEERVEIGQTISARIKEINLETFEVTLESKGKALDPARDDAFLKAFEDMRMDIPEHHRQYMYHGLHPDDAEFLKAKNKIKQKFTPRPISHYLFKNVDSEEAIKALGEEPQGAIVIRPSSRGSNHLTMTWKVSSEFEIYFHIDVREEDQASSLSLGAILTIEEQKFEDLDEIVHRFVEPMAAFSNDLVGNSKFRAGGLDELDQMLNDEHENADKNTRVSWLFNYVSERPGRFAFTYLKGPQNVKREYFKVTPEGYQFRSKTLTTLDTLVGAIKKHVKAELKKGKDHEKRARAGRDQRHPSQQHQHSHQQPPQNMYNPHQQNFGHSRPPPPGQQWGGPQGGPPQQQSRWGPSNSQVKPEHNHNQHSNHHHQQQHHGPPHGHPQGPPTGGPPPYGYHNGPQGPPPGPPPGGPPPGPPPGGPPRGPPPPHPY
jgi:transcription elongation factor SPT6